LIAEALEIKLWPIDKNKLVFATPQERRRSEPHVFLDSRVRLCDPVLAQSSGEVIDGHLRLKAAHKMWSWPGGDTSGIPVILCGGWTDAGQVIPAAGESVCDLSGAGQRTPVPWNCSA
jgi:hypothetical protein